MGITGLLPFVKEATIECHISDFSGQVVAIDASIWLYKGSYSCALELGMGKPTDAYIRYFNKRLALLDHHRILPILVFDGQNLPSKEVTNRQRSVKRAVDRKMAMEALDDGDRDRAFKFFQKAVKVTHEMVQEVIKVLRERRLPYIVSPFEADAQLAYLVRAGYADLVISDDSHLVVFGVPKVFLKMTVDGDGELYDSSKLHLCLGQSRKRFDFKRFRWTCIASGCDYLRSLPNIGLALARRLFQETPTEEDVEKILRAAPTILKRNLQVSEDYVEGFRRAENTFLYQLVFNPAKREVLPLTPYPPSVNPDDLDYCGERHPGQIWNIQPDLALGNINPQTLLRVAGFDPDDPNSGYATSSSIWSRDFIPNRSRGGSMKRPAATGPQEDLPPPPKQIRLSVPVDAKGQVVAEHQGPTPPTDKLASVDFMDWSGGEAPWNSSNGGDPWAQPTLRQHTSAHILALKPTRVSMHNFLPSAKSFFGTPGNPPNPPSSSFIPPVQESDPTNDGIGQRNSAPTNSPKTPLVDMSRECAGEHYPGNGRQSNVQGRIESIMIPPLTTRPSSHSLRAKAMYVKMDEAASSSDRIYSSLEHFISSGTRRPPHPTITTKLTGPQNNSKASGVPSPLLTTRTQPSPVPSSNHLRSMYVRMDEADPLVIPPTYPTLAHFLKSKEQ